MKNEATNLMIIYFFTLYLTQTPHSTQTQTHRPGTHADTNTTQARRPHRHHTNTKQAETPHKTPHRHRQKNHIDTTQTDTTLTPH